MTYLRCPRCKKTVPVRNELLNEARCMRCGKIIRNRGKQLEGIALGTFGLHRQG